MPDTVVDPTGEAAAGTMAGEGPGTSGWQSPSAPTPATNPSDPDLTSDFAGYGLFGLNSDGTYDQQDNGVGAWGANTRDPTLRGVALPEETIRRYIGDPHSPGVEDAIKRGAYLVDVTAGDGRHYSMPLVDIGPGKTTGRGIDLTYAAYKALGLSTDTGVVHYRLYAAEPGLQQPGGDTSGDLPHIEQAEMAGDVDKEATPPATNKLQIDPSPLGMLRQQHPDLADQSDEAITKKLFELKPFGMQYDDYARAMRDPNGAQTIRQAKAKFEQTRNPLQRFMDQHPNYAGQEEDVKKKLFEFYKIKHPQVSQDEFNHLLEPDGGHQSWVKVIADTTIETGRQLLPQSKLTGMEVWKSLNEMENSAIDRNLDTAFGLSYPGATTTEQKQELYSKYYGLKTQEEREKAFKEDLLKQPGIIEKLQQQGLDLPQVLAQFDAGMNGLDHRKDIEQAHTWMNKVVGAIDKESAGTLPENQEKVAKFIAQQPANILMNIVPGLREIGNYAMLYGQNKQYLETKMPTLGADQIDQMARKMADAQFPAQEVLALVMARGGGVITSSLTNKILKGMAHVGLSGAVGSGVFSSNQLIRNLAASQPLTEGLPEEARSGFMVGAIGGGIGMTVENISRFLATSMTGKQVSGTMEKVMTVTPLEGNNFVEGGTENPVTQVRDVTALDLGIAAVDDFHSNLGKTVHEGIVKNAQEEQDQKSGFHAVNIEEPGMPSATESLYKTLDAEALRNKIQAAKEARDAGDFAAAAQHLNSALQDLPQEAHQEIAATIRGMVDTLVEKPHERAETPASDWKELGPTETEADIPAEAERRIDPKTGATSWRMPARAPEQGVVDHYFGTDQAPKEGIAPEADPIGKKLELLGIPDTPEGRARATIAIRHDEAGTERFNVPAVLDTNTGKIYPNLKGHSWAFKDAGWESGVVKPENLESGYVTNKGRFASSPQDLARLAEEDKVAPHEGRESPGVHMGFMPENVFAAGRRTVAWINHFTHFDEFARKWNKIFAPERNAQEARDVAQIGRGSLAGEKNQAVLALRQIAEANNLDAVTSGGLKSERRATEFTKYTKAELIRMISARERGEKIGNEKLDKLFDFYNAVTDYFGKRAKNAGIKMDSWIDNYFPHMIKGDKATQAEAVSKIKRMWGDPSFTKHRQIPTTDLAVSLGYEMRSYNPEHVIQAYIRSVNRAIAQVQLGRQMEEEGYAFNTKDYVPDVAKDWPTIRTPDAVNRHVSPETKQVLENMFSTSSIYDTLAGPATRLAGIVKGFTGIKFAWSGFHAVHIMGVDLAQSLASIEKRAMSGTLKGEDFMHLLSRSMGPVEMVRKGGAPKLPDWKIIPESIRDKEIGGYKGKYGNLIKVMRGEESPETLSDEDKINRRDLLEMGIVPHVSHEREMAWTNWISQQAQKIGPISKAAGIGYKILISEPYQKYMFGKLIPALKISSALEARDSLLRENPNLRAPENKVARMREYDRIQRDIEGRFGEMNYDNLLWNGMAKQLGINVPTSLGWTLGFWRIYGDGVTDTLHSISHFDEIAMAKARGEKAELITERMLYMANYSALAMISCTLASYAATGAYHGIMDAFFPAVGTDKDGKVQRVRTPFFTTEWASLYSHYQKEGLAGGAINYFGNKLNPGLQSLWELWNNKDFRGRQIHDPSDPWPQQMADSAWFGVKNLGLPISVENQVQPNAPAHEGLAAFMGLSPAPSWTGRTGAENDILNAYFQEKGEPPAMTKEKAAVYDAKKTYQQAIVDKDATAIARAKKQLIDLGASPRSISDAEHNATISPADRLFKLLSAKRQLAILSSLNPQERAHYLPKASKEVQSLWYSEH